MPAPPLTTAEYFRMPETLSPQQLVYGLVRDAPAPGHQWAVGEIFVALRAHLEKYGTGRVWMAPIDVVFEVLSPRPRIGRLDERLAWFAQYGVRECWLVHQVIRELEVVEFARGGIANRCLFLPNEPIRSAALTQFDASLALIL